VGKHRPVSAVPVWPGEGNGFDFNLIRKEGVMTEQVSLGLLITLGILVNLYGPIIVREVHRLTNETLLTTRTTLDAAIRILQQLER
jgi:hypothetical protein